MKRILFFCMFSLFLTHQNSLAQSQIVTELADAVTELTGSFLDNPYHHSNTLKINKFADQFKSILDEMYMQVTRYSGADLNCISNLRGVVKCLYFITGNISGYSRGGINAYDWDTRFTPIMTAFGWTWKVIHSTEDIVFYEYSKDDFKMVLAHNILPKKDIGDFNSVAFSCDTWDERIKKYTYGVRRIVFGGYYQFVNYGDDEKQYNVISKVSSKRGMSLDDL